VSQAQEVKVGQLVRVKGGSFGSLEVVEGYLQAWSTSHVFREHTHYDFEGRAITTPAFVPVPAMMLLSGNRLYVVTLLDHVSVEVLP
jgi:hypothetical protein